MMPLPMYTLPTGAPLNWATMMLSTSNPTDLGPKTYVALGTLMVSMVANNRVSVNATACTSISLK